LMRLMASMLFGIAPDDPATLAAAAAAMLVVTLTASWLPARRAASVPPAEALRTDA
jgi:ABC-type lipoprotein release transport system permease subunit